MFDRITLKVQYRKNGKKCEARLYDGGNSDVGFALSKDGERLRIEIIPDGDISLEYAEITTSYYYVPHYKVYLGDRASGVSCESAIFGQSKKRLLRYINMVSPKKVQSKKLKSCSYTYIRDREVYNLFGSLYDGDAFTVFSHHPENKTLKISKRFRGVKISKEYNVFDVFYKKGGYDEVFDAYFEALGCRKQQSGYLIAYSVAAGKKNPVTLERISRESAEVAGFSDRIEVFFADDYWSQKGDWDELDPSAFPNGLLGIAEAIKENGVKAGLVIEPFAVSPKSRAAVEHRMLLEKDMLGTPLLRKGSYHYDVFNSDAQLFIKDMFSSFISCGFEAFKIKGLPAFLATQDAPAKAYAAAELLREATEGKILILCDSPILAAAGRTDYCGIAGSLSPTWRGSLLNRIFRGSESTLNVIMNTIVRRHLDGRAFRNYSSRLVHIGQASKLTPDQKRILMRINQLVGGSVLIKDPVSTCEKELTVAFSSFTDNRKTQIVRVSTPLKNVMQIDYIEEGRERIFSFNYKKGVILNTI